jgi:hypothetical protein
VLQPSVSLPDVERVPAPWSLRGDGWIVLVRLPPRAAAATAFVPPELQPTVRSPLSALMCVDYLEAPCGPYRELLFIPGAMRFPDGRQHPSISRILVSTWASVANGRANWGIPKDRADFFFESSTGGDRIRVVDDGRESCRLEFAPPVGPRLPLATTWLPSRLTRLAQLHEGRVFYYQPRARGSMRFCRLRDWSFDARCFPDITDARVVACAKVDRFEMTFPPASVSDA